MTTKFPPQAVARNVGDVAHDIVELGELQAALVKADLDEWGGRLTMAVIMAGTGGVLLLGSIPVALAALAYVFVEFAAWSVALSFLVAAVIGLVLGGACAAFAWWKFRSSLSVFQRSQEEFNHNVRWLKQVLKHGGDVGHRRHVA